MLSRGRGGLEQTLIDYGEALIIEGHPVHAIIHPDWPGRSALRHLAIEYSGLRSLGEWDPLAARRLRRRVEQLAPAAVLSIGRRAGRLVRRALGAKPALPLIAQTPNYSIGHLVGMDHVIATTNDLKRALVAAGQPVARISVIPYLIRVPADAAPKAPDPSGVTVIGALGRLVSKKGFADWLAALSLLRERGYAFAARIGGDGPEEARLRALVAEQGLEDRVRFLGWVTDRRAFYAELDVLCVPSRHEPFGLVVLEGFAHAVATVVSDAEGPREIVTAGADGLLAPRGDPKRLADAMAILLDDPERRLRLAAAGLQTARARYDLPVVARKISSVVLEVIRAHAAIEPAHGPACTDDRKHHV